MFFEIKNGLKSIEPGDINISDSYHYVGIISLDESEGVLKKIGVDTEKFLELFNGKPLTLENHAGFDMAGLNVLNHRLPSSHGERVVVVFNKTLVIFISRNVSAVSAMMPFLDAAEGCIVVFDRILSTFFERLTEEDVEYLDKIEQEISDLENALITSKRQNCVKEIISLRKRLLVLKRFYEQLLNMLEELQENENDTLHGNSLRYFKIYAGRVERLYHSVLNLRDYVTQVREAYQAEVDISLNNIMKIFTVITAIFLPLTLIVGWYGMNLQLPEFKWAFGYPFVIILSVAVVAFCLIIFKKRKWF
jgi:magnesium transporter